MNKLPMLAAAAVAVSFAGAAFASSPTDNAAGHYEWRSAQQQGPRAPLAAPQRVWAANRMARTDRPSGHSEDTAACRAKMAG
jgi:hypothetical protein